MKKLLPLLLVVVFAGCKKDTDELLTRSWKTTAITLKQNGTSTPLDISPCSRNRIWTFREDGTFLSEPANNCTPDGLEFSLNGTWNLTDKKTLKIEAQGGNAAIYSESQIITIKNSSLILREAVDLTGRSGGRGGSGEGEITYKLEPR